MPVSHKQASNESRSLCEALFNNLSQNIPEMRAKAAAASCSFFQQGGNCFAFIYHRNPGATITVWCLGDYAELRREAITTDLTISPRHLPEKPGSWTDRWRCNFSVDKIDDVADAARLLSNVSYNSPLATKVKERSVASNQAATADTGSAGTYFEGAPIQNILNRYERNSKARVKCIDFHGVLCLVCGFDFEAVYGKAGKGLIHVHHLKPLSTIKRGYKVDPLSDLCPICPNCHAIVHRREPAYSVEEVREMLKRRN